MEAKFYWTRIKGQDGKIYRVLCELKRVYLAGLRIELKPLVGDFSIVSDMWVRRWRFNCRRFKKQS